MFNENQIVVSEDGRESLKLNLDVRDQHEEKSTPVPYDWDFSEEN